MPQPVPVVLLTGACSGLGLRAAVAVARTGRRAVATMRDTGRADALREAAEEAGVGPLLEVRALDVTDEDAALACVAAVAADHGRLDAVVTTAEPDHPGTLEQGGTADVRAVMETGFFGVLHVVRAALPYLRASGGRVVTVTGGAGRTPGEAHRAARAAVEGYMAAFHPLAARVGVHVTVVEPGAVATPDGLPPAARPYDDALASCLARTRPALTAVPPVDDAARVVVDAVTMPDPPLRLQTSDGPRAFAGTGIDDSAVTTPTASWLEPS